MGVIHISIFYIWVAKCSKDASDMHITPLGEGGGNMAQSPGGTTL